MTQRLFSDSHPTIVRLFSPFINDCLIIQSIANRLPVAVGSKQSIANRLPIDCNRLFPAIKNTVCDRYFVRLWRSVTFIGAPPDWNSYIIGPYVGNRLIIDCNRLIIDCQHLRRACNRLPIDYPPFRQ